MKTNIRITFADGGTAIVAFSLRDPARIGIVIKAWALLWQCDVMRWERITDLEAEYWYDGRRKHMRRYDDNRYHDLLEMVIPLAVAIQHRKKAVEEMQRQGHRASEIAEQLKMPFPTVEKMLYGSAGTTGLGTNLTGRASRRVGDILIPSLAKQPA